MPRPRKTDPQQRDWPRIRIIPGSRGFSTFQVDSLRDLTPRVRKNFKTEEEAERYADQLRRQRNDNGLSALGLTPAQVDDAQRAMAIVRQAGIASLSEAAAIAASHQRPAGGDVDLTQLRERFLEHKARKGRRHRTLGDLANRTAAFVTTFRREETNGQGQRVETYPLAKEITPAAVQDWFDRRGFTTGSAQTAKNYRRALNNLFAFALKQRLVASNPVSGVEIPEGVNHVPGILTLAQCRALLEMARTRFPDFIPYITLGLFCGLRPDSELARLAWDDVQLERARVHVPRHKTKMAMARNVTIAPVALEWLLLAPSRQGAIRPAGFRNHWDHLRWLAGFRTPYKPSQVELKLLDASGPGAGRQLAEWPQDGMRHTFATNHLAFHRNAPLTSAEMGHLRPQTMVFYSGLEPRTDPEAFWSLRPSAAIGSTAGNVVALGAAS
jgi:integrase